MLWYSYLVKFFREKLLYLMVEIVELCKLLLMGEEIIIFIFVFFLFEFFDL